MSLACWEYQKKKKTDQINQVFVSPTINPKVSAQYMQSKMKYLYYYFSVRIRVLDVVCVCGVEWRERKEQRAAAALALFREDAAVDAFRISTEGSLPVATLAFERRKQKTEVQV